MIEKADIEAAAEAIAPHIRRTPVLDADGALLEHDAPVSFKLEACQVTGSFKPRGAFWNLMTRDVPKAGIAAASGGNHGAAVAHAARSLGVSATVFVPEISSPAKVAKIRASGADTRIGGATYAEALEACDAFMSRTGAIGIHAYDSLETIAGQGTVGREWQSQTPDLDTLLVAVGGGGLVGGIAAWHRGARRIVAVEPETCASMRAAFDAGAPVAVPVSGVAADSLGARMIGRHVWDIAREHVAECVTVPDEAVRGAVRWLWRNLQLASEAGSACALAALLCGAYRPTRGERVGVLLCGANVSPDKLSEILDG